MDTQTLLRKVGEEISHLTFEVGTLVPQLQYYFLRNKVHLGKGQPILLIPGFLAKGNSLEVMKQVLNLLGFNAHRWRLGQNGGDYDELKEVLVRRLEELSVLYDGQKITLVGQSMGGRFALELAVEYPELVSSVITLGSPIEPDGRYGVDDIPSHIPQSITEKVISLLDTIKDPVKMPPSHIPVTAIAGGRDALVSVKGASLTAKKLKKSPLWKNILLKKSAHISMGFSAEIIGIITTHVRLITSVDDVTRHPSIITV